MKKILFTLLATLAGAAFGLPQQYIGYYDLGDYRYSYELEEYEDADGRSLFFKANLLGLEYSGSGTNMLEFTSVIDLADVDKVFAEIEAMMNENPDDDYVPVKFTCVSADVTEIWTNPGQITSLSLPGTFEDPVGFFRELQSVYPNLRDITISGDGDYTTYDGVVYTADLKELVFCPPTKTSVNIPSACTTLPDSAFASCFQLEKITGGEGLLYVGRNAFGMTSDEAIALGGSPVAAPAIPFVRSFPTNQFMKIGKAVFGFRGVPPARLSLPVGVRAIASGAFADRKFADVEFVGAGTASSLRWVGANAFNGVNAINEVGILDGVIFNFCGRTDGMADPAAWTDREILALTSSAFQGNTAITNITIPASVEEIGDRCFAECSNLESVTFLGTPKKLGDELFAHCSKLKTVRFEQSLMPPQEMSAHPYMWTLGDLVTYVPGSATKWPTDEEGNWCGRALSRSIHVIAQEGVYGKWTLAELGITLPKAGTVFTPKAYGLPSGLVLKSNKAVKNKKGKITTKAKTSWWIEGVPLVALDYATRPAFIVVTLNGKAVWQPLQLEVRALEPSGVLPQLQINMTATDFALPGVGKGWSVSGLPTGLKYATTVVTKRVKTKVKGKTKSVLQTLHKAYVVYGKPTQAGEFTVTAKKKNSNGFYSLKKFWLNVQDEGGSVPALEDPEILSGFTGGAEILKRTIGLSAQLDDIVVSEGTTVTASGLPKGVTLKLQGDRYVFQGVPTAAGTYYVTITAMKNGRKITQRRPFTFGALPAWIAGTYNGLVMARGSDDAALMTLTISSVGKISGKFSHKGKTYTFTRTGLANNGDGCYRIDNVIAGYVPIDSKGRPVPSKTVRMTLGTLKLSQLDCGGVIDNEEEGDYHVSAQQNLWKTDYKSIGTALQRLPHEWTFDDPDYPNLKVTVKLAASGAVKAQLVAKTGIFVKKTVNRKSVRQEQSYAAACSSVLIPETSAVEGAGAFRGVVHLVFPAATKKIGGKTYKFPGYYREISLPAYGTGIDDWASGECRALAQAVPPGLFDGRPTYMGQLSVKVGSSSSTTRPFIGTFKPEGFPPCEFYGKFKRRVEDESVFYSASVPLTFPNLSVCMVELVIRPGEAGGVLDVFCGQATQQDGSSFQLGEPAILQK